MLALLVLLAGTGVFGLRPSILRLRAKPALHRLPVSQVNDVVIEQSSSMDDEPSLNYDWEKQWYAVTYAFNLPSKGEKKPYAFSVFDRELVLWRDDNDEWRCVQDKCPHRAAKLSQGQVLDGKLECLYHGWQFSGQGDCVRIPQLPSNAVIPNRACVQTYAVAFREGVLWVWMGSPDTADEREIPRTSVDLETNAKEYTRYDFQIDLPYDHSYLAENLLDPAHIPISHDRTPGGGRRENAQAFKMTIDKSSISAKGFKGTYQNTRPNKDGSPAPINDISFEAPGIVRYLTEVKSLQFGAALHCMPTGVGKSRLLFTTFFKAPLPFRLIFALQPLWLRHLNSCKVLEQDIGLITSQEDLIARESSQLGEQKSLSSSWLPISSSDLMLVQYRKWLDKAGRGMPFFQGFRTASTLPSTSAKPTDTTSDPQHRMTRSRYFAHVIQNKKTLRALKNIEALLTFTRAGLFASIASGAFANSNIWKLRFLISGMVSWGFAFMLSNLRQLFCVNFKRHEKRKVEWF